MVTLSRRAALAAAGALLVAPAAARGGGLRGLFRIERSKNANIVQYDAVLETLHELDPRSPVVGYWLLKAEDGRREALSELDKRAYGFRVVREPNAASWLMILAASKDRAIRVLEWNNRWVAQIAIRGVSAVLDHFYVAATDGRLVPTVQYVDIFGTSMATGEALTERVTPK